MGGHRTSTGYGNASVCALRVTGRNEQGRGVWVQTLRPRSRCAA
jgi:hypothetical protein